MLLEDSHLKMLLISACVCQRPSWTPKTQPNGAVRRRLVEFLVFNSVYWKKSSPSNGVNRVRRRLVEFLVFNSALGRRLALNSAFYNMIIKHFSSTFFYSGIRTGGRAQRPQRPSWGPRLHRDPQIPKIKTWFKPFPSKYNDTNAKFQVWRFGAMKT